MAEKSLSSSARGRACSASRSPPSRVALDGEEVPLDLALSNLLQP